MSISSLNLSFIWQVILIAIIAKIPLPIQFKKGSLIQSNMVAPAFKSERPSISLTVSFLAAPSLTYSSHIAYVLALPISSIVEYQTNGPTISYIVCTLNFITHSIQRNTIKIVFKSQKRYRNHPRTDPSKKLGWYRCSHAPRLIISSSSGNSKTFSKAETEFS